MIEKHLKYNFPVGNDEPFNIESKGTFFAFANAFSNLSDNLADFSIEKLGQHIPVGYKTIIILNRLIIISNGNEMKRWINKHDENREKKYFLTTNKTIQFYRKDWKSDIDTNVVYKPDSFDASLNSSIWENIDECLIYAKKVSETNDCEVIISEILDSISWH